MTITATQILQLLAKATLLYIHYDVYEDDGEYFIQFEVDWYADEHNGFSYEKVFIDDRYSNTFERGFDSFMKQLDDKLKEKEQKELKEEKRKALIASLTQEQRELLNLD